MAKMRQKMGRVWHMARGSMVTVISHAMESLEWRPMNDHHDHRSSAMYKSSVR
jgi:hypothetical protein